MNDKELIGLAARAAGILPAPDGKCYDFSNKGGLWIYGGGESLLWNPLNDDGDALRLAVKLNMMIEIWDQDYMHHNPHVQVTADTQNSFNDIIIIEPFFKDNMQSVRIAITKAAAEIGKTL